MTQKNQVELLLFASNSCPKCREAKAIIFKLQDEHKFRVRLVDTVVSNLPTFKAHEVSGVPSIALVDSETGFVHSRARECRDAPEIRSRLREWGLVK